MTTGSGLVPVLLTTMICWLNPSVTAKAPPNTCSDSTAAETSLAWIWLRIVWASDPAHPDTIKVPAWGKEGLPDTFYVEDGGRSGTLWLHAVDMAGNVSCASAPRNIVGTVGVPVAARRFRGHFDVMGRRVSRDGPSGVVYPDSGRRVVRLR